MAAGGSASCGASAVQAAGGGCAGARSTVVTSLSRAVSAATPPAAASSTHEAFPSRKEMKKFQATNFVQLAIGTKKEPRIDRIGAMDEELVRFRCAECHANNEVRRTSGECVGCVLREWALALLTSASNENRGPSLRSMWHSA